MIDPIKERFEEYSHLATKKELDPISINKETQDQISEIEICKKNPLYFCNKYILGR